MRVVSVVYEWRARSLTTFRCCMPSVWTTGAPHARARARALSLSLSLSPRICSGLVRHLHVPADRDSRRSQWRVQWLVEPPPTAVPLPSAPVSRPCQAHLTIKRAVVLLVGDRVGVKEHWGLNDDELARLPEHSLLNILRNMRTLVVAYDNLTPQQKRMLTTTIEVFKNRDVLIKIARHALALERREVRRQRRGALESMHCSAMTAELHSTVRYSTVLGSMAAQDSYARHSTLPSLSNLHDMT